MRIGKYCHGSDGALTNYYILLPMFENFLPMDQLIAAFQEYVPFIDSKLDIVLFNAVPFNLVKGIFISALAMIIYKPLSSVLNSSYSASVKWNTLYDRMKKDKGNPGVTMDMDQNMIGMNLVNLFQSGVITEEDLEGFSSDFRKWAVSFMSD